MNAMGRALIEAMNSTPAHDVLVGKDRSPAG